MSEQNGLLPDKPEYDAADSQDTEQEVVEQLDDQEGNFVLPDHSSEDQNSLNRFRPHIPWSHLIRSKHARRSAIAALILLASSGLYLLYTVLPATAATITIMPTDRLLVQSYVFTIAAQPNPASHQVSGHQLTYTTSTKTQIVPVHYTGHLDATPASGKVVFSTLREKEDLLDLLPLHIPLTSDEYVSVDPVTITLQPDSTYTLTAHVVPAGASGNIPAYTINDNYALFSDRALRIVGGIPPYAVHISNPEPFTGGKDAYDGPLVNAVDTQPVEHDLTTQLQQEALQAFQSHLHPGEALLKNLQCLPNIQEQPPINSPATSVTITASLNCTIGTYDATTTHARILKEMQQLASQSLDSPVTLRGPLQFTLVTSSINTLPGEPDTFVLWARGQWRLLLDQHGKLAVQQALAGLSQDNARMTLQNRFAARTLALELAWWWGKRLPLDPAAIQIVARYPPSS